MQLLRPGREPPITAYHCQQAGEKLLKGFLVRAETDFGRTHDLEHLGYLVVRQFPAVHSLVEPLAAWTHWAGAYRYPDVAVMAIETIEDDAV
jgi:HEPN domain-containing protein